MRISVPALAAAALAILSLVQGAPPLFVPGDNVTGAHGGHGGGGGGGGGPGGGNAPANLTDLGAGANPTTAGTDISSGLNPNSSAFVRSPTYRTFSAFDFQSLSLALHQTYLELDIFNQGVSRFNDSAFAAQNMTADDISLLRYMAQQEEGHATLLTNILGPRAPKSCTYRYPDNVFASVANYVNFGQRLTRGGESGVIGSLALLDNRAIAQLLLQSVTIESRQQTIFRQWTGIFPMPVWFEPGIPQTWAWTLLSRYISSCPTSNVPLDWQIFPRLRVLNNANAARIGLAAGGASITHNASAFIRVGDEVRFRYDRPGRPQGPYNQRTARGALTVGKRPRWAAWVSQLNITYSQLYDVHDGFARTRIPGGVVFPAGLATNSSGNKEIINGTMFVALTSVRPSLTPANLSIINPYMVAGPEIFQAG